MNSNGDYSGGSQSGSKKKMKDIDQSDVAIKGFEKVERTRSEMDVNRSERMKQIGEVRLEDTPAE
jgi:hypothetical protein